jgi:hypothetical protein
MKKSILLSCIATLCLCASVNAQTIRRVNNTPGLNDPNVYATAQAAHDAAAANDIISLEPSPSTSYGNITVTKRINIVGSGYYLDKNPNNFFDKRQATLSSVIFDNGSANSTISGVDLSSVVIYDVNINVTRCKLNNITMSKSNTLLGGIYSVGNNATINQNLITGYINAGQYYNASNVLFYAGANCNVSNNVIAYNISGLNSSVINYNTFLNEGNGANINTVVGSTVTNNIFDCRSATLGYLVVNAASSGTTASNNICLGLNGLPSGGGNINGASPTTTFVGTSTPFSTYGTTGDGVFQLAVGSPALTAAVGGTQAGAFGNGANTYRLSGVPVTPIITSFISTGSGNNTTPLSVTISVRSNN